MVMAESEGGDDQKEVNSGPKSPWKTPVVADAPVMGAESWPALADAHHQQRSKSIDSATKPTSVPSPTQGSVGQHKSNGSGNPNSSHKYSSSRHQKLGSKRNPNVAPPFPVPFPYQQPTFPPVFHAMVPPPHIAVSGYAYQPGLAPFPSIETHLVKSGSDSSTVQPFVPSVNVQTPPRGDPNAFAVNFSNRRPSVPEPGPPICYVPVAPTGSFRGGHPPRFMPYPTSPGAPLLPQETPSLRESIIRQIDYYFSDENLKTDHYLISLMDGQGWVPISTIADFNRVKKMTTDILFILDALQSSSTVEVQGDKIRRRDEWLKWIPASAEYTSSSKTQTSESQLVNPANEDNARDPNEKSVADLNIKLSYLDSSCNAAYVAHSDGTEPAVSKYHAADGMGISLHLASQNLGDLSSDFANTFMLDEELELEQKTQKSDCVCPVRRIDDEEDEILVNDQDVQRLVIVTQCSIFSCSILHTVCTNMSEHIGMIVKIA
ncbi:hypothetical protein GH714_008062 [Hevea brasiliensis]|uniref:HTH La-type RNA-binding domain-containing protein n=1 Tax=Hevea brasiliensis TaxID=3981 RepID=A0A6A6NGC3_HEVBR|nr:hypothetical protein GH714_008062 [Hevea brasiliensis]